MKTNKCPFQHASEVDLMDPAVQENGFPAYDLIREESPAYFMEQIGMYVLTRYDDIEYVLKRPEAFTGGDELQNNEPLIKYPESVKLYEKKAGLAERPSVSIYRCTPSTVTLSIRYGAGNHDPRRFPEPMTPDLDRKNAGRHLAFGMGEKVCPGATLSRLEQRWAWETLFNRLKRHASHPQQEYF